MVVDEIWPVYFGVTRVNVVLTGFYEDHREIKLPVIKPQTKAEKNQARLKQLRGRAGRWA